MGYNDNFNFESAAIAVDTETTGSNSWKDGQVFCVSMCDDDGEKWSCQWEVDPVTRQVSPDPETWGIVQKVLSNPDITKIFHNAPFDYKMLRKMDFDINGRIEDTLFMARILSNVSQNNGLKELAFKYADIPMEDVDILHANTISARAFGKSWGWTLGPAVYFDYWMPAQVFEGDMSCQIYAEQDVYRTICIWMIFNKIFASQKIDPEGCFRKTYERELRLFHVVMRMEDRGVGISREKCIHEKAESEKAMVEAYKQMRELVGFDFSPSSPKQLVPIIFEHFGLPILERTDKGDPSTRLVALRPHAHHPFINQLLTHRSAHKSVGTFFENYLECMTPDRDHPGCHNMHPNINQLITRTARFSMNDPNLQQVANANTSTLGGRMVMARRPFGPRPGYCWFPTDYAQQELRIFADLAGIQHLIQAVKDGKDPNTENANFAWGGRGNHAAITAAKLALELKDPVTSRPEVQEIWDRFNWNPDEERMRGGMESRRAEEIAKWWLDQFDWQIVQAEATLGKKNTRSRCKIVTFDIMYGGGAKSLMGLLFCTLDEAKTFLNTMHKRYPEIRRFSSKLMRQLGDVGYIINPYGRRLKTEVDREYTCVNYLIQSSAADMMKDSMIRCQNIIDKERLDGHMVLTVHDELVFEIRKEHAHRWFLTKLRNAMEYHPMFKMPTKAEMSAAPVQWDRKIPVELDCGHPNDNIYDIIKTKIVSTD